MTVEIKAKDVQQVELGKLVENPKNPNRHSIEQIERLAKLIKHNGFRDPIIVSKRTGFILCGHGRKAAAEKLGMTHIPVSYQDFANEAEEFQFMTAHNEIARWAELDMQALYLELPSLTEAGIDLDLLGIDDFHLPTVENLPAGDPDDIPGVKEEAVTKQGDVWVLGRHRLMCGDSTMIDDVEKLMNGEKADTCFTSPPYNLGNNSKLRGYNGDGDDSAYIEKSDHKTEAEYLQFLSDFTDNVLAFCHTAFINIQLLAGNKTVVPEYWHRYRQNVIDVMIWDKEHAQPSAAERVLNSVWEFIFILCNEEMPKRTMKHGPVFRGTVDNIYRLNPNGKKDPLAKDHGAVFPVDFAKHVIGNFSDDLILEPFGGSGTTIIAAQSMDRRCFSMEIDPRYCDVIIKRFQKFSGEKALLQSSGKTFDQISVENGSV